MDVKTQEIKSGWRISVDDVSVDAEHPYLERGVVKASLCIRNCEVIYYKDRVTLTSERARKRVLQKLEEKGVNQVCDEHLMALEEVCRRRHDPPEPSKKIYTVGSPDISGKVSQLTDIKDQITSFLLLRDPDVVDVTLGAMAAHRLGGSPVWLLIVAPPSGTKTEIIRALEDVLGVYFLSELTSRTLASGLDTKGEDPSLLARLKDEVLLLKDFTSVLEMHRDERQSILAPLREIYDGRYDKAWGTGKELHWQGRLGLIAGVTPVIDSYHSVLSVLGERFVILRMIQAERQETAKMALKNIESEDPLRQQLAQAVASFLGALPASAPTISEGHREQLAALADFVTRCRSGVVRDGYKRELEYAPEPEMPARFAKQLYNLLRGIALIRGRDAAQSEDYDCVARVALDCVPAVRRMVLQTVIELSEVDADNLTTTKVAQSAQYSTSAVRRALEDLQALGILRCEKGGQGKADKWFIRDDWSQAIETVKKVESSLESRIKATFPEKSRDPTMYNSEPATEEEPPDSAQLSATPPSRNVTPSQPSNDAGISDFQNVTQDIDVTDEKTRKPSNDVDCDGVTFRKGGFGQKQTVEPKRDVSVDPEIENDDDSAHEEVF